MMMPKKEQNAREDKNTSREVVSPSVRQPSFPIDEGIGFDDAGRNFSAHNADLPMRPSTRDLADARLLAGGL